MDGAQSPLVDVEAGFEAAKDGELGAAEEAALAEAVGPAGFEGIAEGGDSGFGQRHEDGAEDAGKQMGVFVGVGVGEKEAGRLETTDLGDGLAGDVVGVDVAAKDIKGEAGEGGAEKLALWSDKGRNGAGVGGGDAVGKDDVAADAKARVATRDGNGIVESGARGHEGGGGEHAGPVELFDGAVDAGSQAEVIGVDDETRGHGDKDTGDDARWCVAGDLEARATCR